MRLDAVVPLLLVDHAPLPLLGRALWERAQTPEGPVLGRRISALAARLCFAVVQDAAAVTAVDHWLRSPAAQEPPTN